LPGFGLPDFYPHFLLGNFHPPIGHSRQAKQTDRDFTVLIIKGKRVLMFKFSS
jgi:hypothetical protein